MLKGHWYFGRVMASVLVRSARLVVVIDGGNLNNFKGTDYRLEIGR